MQFAAERQSEAPVLGFPAEDRPVRGSADGEEALAIRQLDELRENDARCPERRVDVPDRTGALTGYDEPKTLSCSMGAICPRGADVRQGVPMIRVSVEKPQTGSNRWM